MIAGIPEAGYRNGFDTAGAIVAGVVVLAKPNPDVGKEVVVIIDDRENDVVPPNDNGPAVEGAVDAAAPKIPPPPPPIEVVG